MQPTLDSVKLFKGIKNDVDSKQVPTDAFYGLINVNYPDTGILGLESILYPEQIQQIGTKTIDGIFEYRYLDTGGTLQTRYIVVTDGKIYRTDLTTATLLKSGLTAGQVSFCVYNDILYIANGKDYIQKYSGSLDLVAGMGAPFAEGQVAGGNPAGAYYYAVTYVTAGGEEIVGSVSNTVTVVANKILLSLPLGYSGTLTRNIYRTTGGGAALKFLATVPDNVTLTYLDNIADASLGAGIGSTNNELPKPYFMVVANQKLYAGVVDKYPTQIFITGTNIEVIDSASYLDVANYGTDNTPVRGIGVDFNKVIVGTDRNIVMIDPDGDTVIITRSNVGIKNGYSVQPLPAFGDFPGGLMFVSSLNDVRLMSGLQSLPVATSVDNVRTENWAQDIRGDLDRELDSITSLCSLFYKNRYHLVINDIKYVFDIRTRGWTKHDIQTKTYNSQPRTFGILGGFLYNGQPDGWLEKEYQETTYRGEDCIATFTSGHIAVSNYYSFVNRFIMWFIPSAHNSLRITVVTDDNTYNQITQTFAVETTDFRVIGGVYKNQVFSSTFFNVDKYGMDYRTLNINRPCRWVRYVLEVLSGSIGYQGFTFEGQLLPNKEG
jgi:hypothetical protein